MSLPLYLVCIVVIVLLVSAFPLYQVSTSGYLFYVNGWDEASYLQYDYARHVLELSSSGRASQSLVVLAHELGLSGGWINFVLDLAVTIFLLISLPALLHRFFMAKRDARVTAISLLGLPLLISNLNPIVEALSTANLNSNTLSWLTVPVINDPFWLRSPEPQISIIFASLFLYLSSLLEIWWLRLVPLPLLYPFIAIPLTFVYAALLLNRCFKKIFPGPMLACLAAAFLVSLVLKVYYAFFAGEFLKGYLIPTYLPLISFGGLLALGVYWRHSREPFFFKSVALFSIWFAVNFQMVSGFTIQPNNFEQYWSAGMFSLLLLLSVNQKARAVLGLISISLLAGWSYSNFRLNHEISLRLNLTPDLISDLASKDVIVAINDIPTSTRADMLLPKQGNTLFSYTRFYKKLPSLRFPEYACAKRALGEDQRFTAVIEQADAYFKGGDQNAPLNTILRVEHPSPVLPEGEAAICPVSVFVTRHEP
ncbi:MAG: hypothetical protein J5J00_09040 [Deltaproteobacteria bacterium]|nr:hypothetical protein [Deltaproteobacteria bacterium]